MITNVGPVRHLYHRAPAALVSDRGASAPAAPHRRAESLVLGGLGATIGLLLTGAVVAIVTGAPALVA